MIWDIGLGLGYLGYRLGLGYLGYRLGLGYLGYRFGIGIFGIYVLGFGLFGI